MLGSAETSDDFSQIALYSVNKPLKVEPSFSTTRHRNPLFLYYSCVRCMCARKNTHTKCKNFGGGEAG